MSNRTLANLRAPSQVDDRFQQESAWNTLFGPKEDDYGRPLRRPTSRGTLNQQGNPQSMLSRVPGMSFMFGRNNGNRGGRNTRRRSRRGGRTRRR